MCLYVHDMTHLDHSWITFVLDGKFYIWNLVNIIKSLKTACTFIFTNQFVWLVVAWGPAFLLSAHSFLLCFIFIYNHNTLFFQVAPMALSGLTMNLSSCCARSLARISSTNLKSRDQLPGWTWWLHSSLGREQQLQTEPIPSILTCPSPLSTTTRSSGATVLNTPCAKASKCIQKTRNQRSVYVSLNRNYRKYCR